MHRDAGFQLDLGLEPDDWKPMPVNESIGMSVWDDVADDATEAQNLKLRAALIRAIRSRVDEIGWSQTAAAQNLGITQPRLSDLYRGKISKFSLDALVEIASKLGIHVRVEIEPHFAVPNGN